MQAFRLQTNLKKSEFACSFFSLKSPFARFIASAFGQSFRKRDGWAVRPRLVCRMDR